MKEYCILWYTKFPSYSWYSRQRRTDASIIRGVRVMSTLKTKVKNLPDAPGVYMFRDSAGKLLYIGKATSLKKRVGSYFLKAHDNRIQAMVDQVASIHINTTRSALEALLLEAQLIKKYLPPYNILEKDDKTFASIAITDEPIPRVIVTRPTHKEKVKLKYIYGPYTNAATAYTAIKLIRRIFPFHTEPLPSSPLNKGEGKRRHHPPLFKGGSGGFCFDAKIGLCPGVCGGTISMAQYRKSLAQLRLFLEGKRERVIASLNREMKTASKQQHYERAAQIRDTLHALEHIRDVALLTTNEFGAQPRTVTSRTHSYYLPHRVEAYDISHVSGEDAVGSMVVFTNGKIDSNQYRHFKVRGKPTPDDTRMMKEILDRRLNHPEWPYPDLLLIDGGSPQLHAAQQVLRARNLTIPVAALAKGPERKRADLYSADPAAKLIPRTLLVHLREESHRFAIRYHRLLKRKGLVGK